MPMLIKDSELSNFNEMLSFKSDNLIIFFFISLKVYLI